MIKPRCVVRCPEKKSAGNQSATACGANLYQRKEMINVWAFRIERELLCEPAPAY